MVGAEVASADLAEVPAVRAEEVDLAASAVAEISVAADPEAVGKPQSLSEDRSTWQKLSFCNRITDLTLCLL